MSSLDFLAYQLSREQAFQPRSSFALRVVYEIEQQKFPEVIQKCCFRSGIQAAHCAAETPLQSFKSGAAVELTKPLWQRLPNKVLLLAQLLAGFLAWRKSPYVFW